MNQELQNKIDSSIALIQRAEKLALKMSPSDGFLLAFSGGKDSQVCHELMKMAGVQFQSIFNVTTNDPAENIIFIKHNYPDVIFDIPKTSFIQLVTTNGLPTFARRWCCRIFKESKGSSHVVVAGIRKEESKKRAQYKEVTKAGKRKENYIPLDLTEMENNQFQCVNGQDKIMLYPILDWTTFDVWQFIKMRNLPINPCYKIYRRVGCIFCPFKSRKEILTYCQTHPKQKQALIKAMSKYIERGKDKVKISDANDYFEFWVNGETYDEYLARKNQLELPL